MFCSFSYDVTRTVQHNMGPSRASDTAAAADEGDGRDMFVWNHFALQPLLSTVSAAGPSEGSQWPVAADRWVVPIIHGYLQQKTVRLSSGTALTFTVIARRSRVFAGTRYLRRGVDCEGYTANEVESEQVVTLEGGPADAGRRSASLVQVRGSVPLFWHHTNIFVPSPDIKVLDAAAPPLPPPSSSSKSTSKSSTALSAATAAAADDAAVAPVPPCDGFTAAIRHFDRLYGAYGDYIRCVRPTPGPYFWAPPARPPTHPPTHPPSLANAVC